jgi:hypothetical protein
VTDAGRDAWPRDGVHRVLGTAEAVAAELARRGWDVAVVPPATSDDAFWDGLVAALGLPAWFGRNLDALDEALGDRAGATALVLGGWSAYAGARPERWAGLLDVLSERRDPPLVVLLTDWPPERGSSDRADAAGTSPVRAGLRPTGAPPPRRGRGGPSGPRR